ncbi:MAG: hypothetical protein DHS20C02_11730 [Micavibrio sp.]|nr:MAG: hypothetical protein DHS20C02_11730 [Micavibrio sp.]
MHTSKEAVGVFGSEQEFVAAIDELYDSGFTHENMEILADTRTSSYRFTSIKEVEDDPQVPRSYIVPRKCNSNLREIAITTPICLGVILLIAFVAAFGSWPSALIIMITAVATGVVCGGIGIMLARRVDKRHGAYIQRQIDLGGLPLWVHLKNRNSEEKALEVLKHHHARDVHVLNA